MCLPCLTTPAITARIIWMDTALSASCSVFLYGINVSQSTGSLIWPSHLGIVCGRRRNKTAAGCFHGTASHAGISGEKKRHYPMRQLVCKEYYDRFGWRIRKPGSDRQCEDWYRNLRFAAGANRKKEPAAQTWKQALLWRISRSLPKRWVAIISVYARFWQIFIHLDKYG